MDHSDSLSDVPVEGAVGNSANPLPPGLTEEEAEELRVELTKVTAGCFCSGWVRKIDFRKSEQTKPQLFFSGQSEDVCEHDPEQRGGFEWDRPALHDSSMLPPD